MGEAIRNNRKYISMVQVICNDISYNKITTNSTNVTNDEKPEL